MSRDFVFCLGWYVVQFTSPCAYTVGLPCLDGPTVVGLGRRGPGPKEYTKTRRTLTEGSMGFWNKGVKSVLYPEKTSKLDFIVVCDVT